MKKYGLIVATSREFESFLLEEGSEAKTLLSHGRKIQCAKVGDSMIYAIESGCGEIDAANAAQQLISEFSVGAILNYGVAGALDPTLKVSDCLIVKKIVHYDFDTSPIDPVKPHQYHDFPDEFIPLDEKLRKTALSLNPSIKEVICASGDKFVEDQTFKRELFSTYKAQICEMEAAGIALTCHRNGIPCLLIKAISDEAGGNGKDFEKNVRSSGLRAYGLLKLFLKGA